MSGFSDLPVSARGQKEILLLCQRLRQDRAFARIYASSSQRALETAHALVAHRLGPLAIWPELREINCGIVDGLPIERVRAEHPTLWAANLQQCDANFRWPGGESYAEFRARCVSCIERIAAEHHGQRVAIVTHAGVVSEVLGYMHGLSPAAWQRFRPNNTALTELEISEREWRLLYFDESSHLDELFHSRAS